MKWHFHRQGRGNQKEGIVGIYVAPSSIAIAYAVSLGLKIMVKSYVFHKAAELSAKQAILQQFVIERGLQGVPCSYVLAPGEYSLNLVEEPTVPKDEVPKALRWILRDLVNFPLKDAVIDTFELPFLRAKDNMKMIYAASMPKEMLSKIASFIAPSALVLKYIDIPELVLKNIVNFYSAEIKGCALLYVGSKCGILILTKNRQLCIVRSFELKADDLDKSLTKDSRILEILSLEIQRSYDYIGSIFHQNIPNLIVLVPTWVDRNIMQESFKSSLGAEIIFLTLAELMTFEKPINAAEEAEGLLAIGSVLREWELHEATN